MIYAHTDYRSYLKDTLNETIKRNPRFSMRMFSEKLGLSPAGLCRILKGEKSLSTKRAQDVAEKIGLKGSEAEFFNLLVENEKQDDQKNEQKNSVQEKIETLRDSKGPVHNLEVDQFKLISDWHHFAILEMISIKDVEVTPAAISLFLHITPLEAETALDRLERLQLIVREQGKRPERKQNNVLVNSEVPNEAIRTHYKQVLDKAVIAVDTQGPDEKVIGTEMFAFDQDQLDEARAITEEYFQKMIHLSKKGKKRESVYQVAVQFFRISKRGKKK